MTGMSSMSGYEMEEIRLSNHAEKYGEAYPETGCKPLFGWETYVTEYLVPEVKGFRVRKKEILVYLDDDREIKYEINENGELKWLHW